MKIINVIESPRKHKRLRAFFNNGVYIDFGLKNGSTYIDHKDEFKRQNYIKRHMSNKKEHELIVNLIPSPALLSYAILWGPHTDIIDNINYLNKLMNK